MSSFSSYRNLYSRFSGFYSFVKRKVPSIPSNAWKDESNDVWTDENNKYWTNS